MTLEMRELKGDDLFTLLSIVGKMDIKDEFIKMFENNSNADKVVPMDKQKKEPTKAVATAEAVQMIRNALPDKPASDITSTDVANAVAFYMGQATNLNDEGLAMVQNLAKYICDNSVSEKNSENS